MYRLQGVEFEWDTNKFQINLEKHGVSFEEAAEVFFDPFYQEGDATANDEQRNFILGYSRTQHSTPITGCLCRTQLAKTHHFFPSCYPH
ncbi:BrnT family toxin [Microcoleus sp. D3_18a_C4]